jgi:hypothetical protein
MQYEELQPIAKDEAERELQSGDRDRVARAMLRLSLFDPDFRSSQELCLTQAQNADPWLRGVAAICLGHLARLHGTLDTARVIPMLQRLAEDPETAGKAQDALEDIEHFLGLRR